MTLQMQSFVDRIERVIFQSLANCYLFVIYFEQITKPWENRKQDFNVNLRGRLLGF